MTTQVKVTACCTGEKEVEIKITGKQDVILQDRESYDDVVYDDVCIAVRERIKRLEQMLPHRQRVVDEKAELDKKAKALSNFIGLSDIFPTLDAEEQERLKEQCEIMHQYSEILGKRIEAF